MRIGGGLEAYFRRIFDRRMDVDGSYLAQYLPQDGLVTPRLWGLRADLFKKRAKSLKNYSFS